MTRRSARMTSAVGCALTLIGSIGVSPLPAGSQDAPPTWVTLSPPAGDPGSSYDVAIMCEEEPTGSVIEVGSDAVLPLSPTSTGDDRWVATLEAGRADALIDVRCGEQVVDVRFDAEWPTIFLGPRLPPAGLVDPPQWVGGTDCDSEDGVLVGFAWSNGSFDGLVTVETDEYGDWQTPLELPPPGVTATVYALCDTLYPSISYTSPAEGPPAEALPGTTVPVAPPTEAPPASAAQPVAAAPAYTG